MTSSPERFNFDLDLGSRPGERTRLVQQSTLEDELNKARREGYAQGFEEGERSASAEAARALSTAAVSLADKSGAMNSAFTDALEKLTGDAAELAMAAARKLSASLIERFPYAEIEGLLAECLATVQDAPHMVVRCHPDLADAVRDIAAEQARISGFEGRLVVMGEPEIKLGDCRIEWADGGLVRDIDATAKAMDEKIARFHATHGKEPAKETDQ